MCDFVVTVIDMSGVNTCPLERFTRLGVILNTLLMVVVEFLFVIIFSMLSMRMLLRRQGHGDGSLSSSHTQRQRCEAGGWAGGGRLCVRLPACRRTHSLGSPFDIHGTLLSDTLRQKACCEPREAGPR